MSIRVPSGPPQAQGAGEDPLTHYTRIFAKFLQLVFASFEPGDYKWLSDNELTEIVIQGEGTVANEVVEKRPAIIVKAGPAAFGNVAIDQFKGYDFETGRRSHTDLVSSVCTINALSTEGLESRRLAWICLYAVRALKRALMRAGMHRVGEELQMGDESPPGALVSGDPKEIIMVSVSVPFYFQNSWSVEPIDKTLLNEISVAVRSEAGFPAPGAVPIRDLGINGRTLSYTKLVSLDSRVLVPPTGPRRRK